jgi:tetratricopeptide (TPR) repeat protein
MFAKHSAPDNNSIPSASLAEYKYYWQNNLNDEALALCQHNAELFPTDSRINYYFGIELDHSGRLEEAVASYKVAINNYATIPKISLEMLFIRLADSLNELRLYDEALKYADKVLNASAPRYSTTTHDPHLCRAESLYGLGRNQEAFEAIEKSVALNPNGFDSHYIQGCILYRLNRYEECILAFDRAIAIDPNDDTPYNDKASAMFELGQYQSAIAVINETIRRKIDKEFVHFLKMGAEFRLGSGVIEQSAYDYLQAFNPGSPALIKLKQDIIESMQSVKEPPTKKQKKK